MEKKTNKKNPFKKDLNPIKGYDEKNKRNNMLINAKKNMDEKAQGYIISDETWAQR
jgi:hypothetical protein